MAYSNLHVFRDPDELSTAAAEQITKVAKDSISARGRFTLCLTGGSTPRRAYSILAAQKGEAAIDWSRTYLFFGDERFVPHDDDRSNYKMVRESLLQNPAIAEDHVFAVPTDLATPEQAAEEYARTLREFFGASAAWPAFDMVLLGLGDDGHFASLFPGAAALDVRDRWATSSPPGVLPPPVDRVTLTFPAINAARWIMFLVSGAKKAVALAAVLRGRYSSALPAAGICPSCGPLHWFVDQAAAGMLTP